MKKVLVFAITMTVSLVALANPISQSKAQGYADSFMKSHGKSGAVIAVNTVAASKGLNGSATDSGQAYYVFNATSSKAAPGYVIISGDDRMPRVLGYSLDGSWPSDESRVPTPLRIALKNYTAYVEAVRSGAVASPAVRTSNGQGTPIVGPLIKTKWNQSYPYNKYAPVCPDTLFVTRFQSHFPIGCVAVGMAQIINYWGQKTGKPANPSNHDTYATCVNFFDPAQPTDTLNFSLSESTKYDWANMPDSIGHRPDTVCVMSHEEWERKGEAVGIFLRDVAYSINMEWMSEGGGAFDAWSGDIMSKVFGFSIGSRFITTSGYGKAKQYIDLIKADFDKGWPVLAEGTDEEAGGGHCFVYDGYDSNDYIHVNWGWGGDCDAFFDLAYLHTNEFDSRATHDYNFSTDEGITIGIHPREGIETPQLDVNNIGVEYAGYTFDSKAGAAIQTMLKTSFDDGSKPVAYLDKYNNVFRSSLVGVSYHKSLGYDYDLRLEYKNTNDGTVKSMGCKNTTLKNPSRSASGEMNVVNDFATSDLTDGFYYTSGYIREILNGNTSDWVGNGNRDSLIISGKDVIVNPGVYRQYYHGKQCAHHWQDRYNNALFHVEFTKNPENITVGDKMLIIMEAQLVADNNLKYDATGDQRVLLTVCEDGQAVPDILIDDTDSMKVFLQNAEQGLSTRGHAWEIPFEAKENYAGKTLHLTYSWPALGISMTNDINVVSSTGIETVRTVSSNEKEAGCYTLSGIRIKEPAKGQLYIRNGRKVIKNN